MTEEETFLSQVPCLMSTTFLIWATSSDACYRRMSSPATAVYVISNFIMTLLMMMTDVIVAGDYNTLYICGTDEYGDRHSFLAAPHLSFQCWNHWGARLRNGRMLGQALGPGRAPSFIFMLEAFGRASAERTFMGHTSAPGRAHLSFRCWNR